MPSLLPQISHLIDRFSSYQEANGKSKETIRSYCSDIGLAISKLDKEKFSDLDDLINSIALAINSKKNGISERTITRKMSALNGFSKYLFSQGIIKEPHIFPNPRREHSYIENRPINDEEFHLLLDSVRPTSFNNLRFRAMTSLIYGAGLSSGEVSNVLYTHLIKENEEPQAINVIDGSFNGRIVGLENEVSKELKEYDYSYQKILDRSEYLFLNKFGEKLTSRALRNDFIKFKKKSGIDFKLSLTSLRFGYAKRLKDEGYSKSQIAHNMGLENGQYVEKLIKIL